MTALAPVPDRRRMTADRRKGGGRRVEELHAALRETQIEILFQPQFACDDGRLLGAEALSRWNHPRLGRIGVEALFDIAERSGEAARLTRHIAGRALATAAGWPAPLRLSLNVTAMDLAEEDFAENIAVSLVGAGFDPRRLTLEITEQALVYELDRSAVQLERLASQGIHIALDDFGAGFCNFRYLKRLPLDCLKLDRSMIEGITEDERDRAVLRGIMVLAEGIETEAQRDAVAREGCAAWQGFLGAEAMSSDAFLAFAGK